MKSAKLESLRNKQLFTSGDVALICRVAPRTATKWFDHGLLGGYKIPLCNDRRVPRSDLVKFMTEKGIPLGILASTDRYRVLGIGDFPPAVCSLLIAEGIEFRPCGFLFEAGHLAATMLPDCVLIDFYMGRAESIQVARFIKSLSNATKVIGVVAEDETDLEFVRSAAGFDVLVKRPVAWSDVVGQLRRWVVKEVQR